MNQPMKPLTKPAPLGRGLSALFGDADSSYSAPRPSPVAPVSVQAAPVRAEKTSPTSLPVAWLHPGAFQPRRYFDDEALKGLADSIRERGVLEPLVVRLVKDRKDAYEIIAGERRWRASQLAGLHDVPVVLRDLTDREALEFGLIENVQRQDLSPLEEAEGYKRLLEEFDHTQENLAKIVGKSRPHITNLLRILTLPLPVRQMIERGELSMGHARAVITAENPLELAIAIQKKGLNVRQAEALAQKASGKPMQVKARKAAGASEESADVLALEKELTRVIGLRVKIATSGKAGTLTLHYQDLDQLDDIIKKLGG